MRYIKKGTWAAMSARNIYLSPILSLVLGTAVVFASDLSTIFIVICGGLIGLQVFHLIIGFIKDKHLDKKWHALTNHVIYNVAALFCWMPFWIVTGMKAWLFIILFSISLSLLVLGYRFYKTVAIGVFSSKKNRFGTYFSIASLIWLTLSGGGSYGYTKLLQAIYGYSNALVIIATLLVPFSYILMFIALGLWVRVKDPNFAFEKNVSMESG